jgi:hypothetical protein
MTRDLIMNACAMKKKMRVYKSTQAVELVCQTLLHTLELVQTQTHSQWGLTT